MRKTTQIRWDGLQGIARLAGEGVMVVPVAHTHSLKQVRDVAELSQSRRSEGELVLVL